MLTKEQLQHCMVLYANADSAFDAISDIADYLGRPLTTEERKEVADAYTEVDVEECEQVVGPATGKESCAEKSFRMKLLASSLAELYAAKNRDYGDSFGTSVRRYGLIAALTRISDKFNRAESLILGGEDNRQVKDEKLRDTLLDLASYALMTVLELDNEDEED